MAPLRVAYAGAVLLLLAACGATEPAAAPHAMDERPAGRVVSDRWTATVDAGGDLRVTGPDGEHALAARVDPRVALQGDTIVYAQEGPLRETELWLRALPDGAPVQLTTGPGSADRPVLSPDGQRVAYVSGRSGVASWWVVDLRTLAHTQLTNTSLGPRRPGQPPEGWTPVPDSHDYGWTGATLTWVAAGERFTVQP